MKANNIPPHLLLAYQRGYRDYGLGVEICPYCRAAWRSAWLDGMQAAYIDDLDTVE